MLRRALLVVVMVLAGVLPAHATSFTATYTFTGSAGDQVSEPVDANPVGATFADLTRGAGIAAEAGANSINSRGWTTTATLDPTDYYQLVITADALHALTVDSLAWTMRRSATGPLSFEWRSSLDAFATPFATFSLIDTTVNVRMTVSSLGTLFADLSAPLTLRLFGFAAEGPLGTFRLGISSSDAGSTLPDNLTVTGDLRPVPEPTSMLLLGTGLAVAGLRRWHSRRVA